jgi:hypothetical protein
MGGHGMDRSPCHEEKPSQSVRSLNNSKKEFFRKDDAFNLALEPCEDVTTAD